MLIKTIRYVVLLSVFSLHFPFASMVCNLQYLSCCEFQLSRVLESLCFSRWSTKKLSVCYLRYLAHCHLDLQLLDTGFFHADPHPGNMIRTPDGKLAILDFGNNFLHKCLFSSITNILLRCLFGIVVSHS